MKNKIFSIFVLTVLALVLLGCVQQPSTGPSGDGQSAATAAPIPDSELDALDAGLNELDLGLDDLNSLDEVDIDPLSLSDFE